MHIKLVIVPFWVECKDNIQHNITQHTCSSHLISLTKSTPSIRSHPHLFTTTMSSLLPDLTTRIHPEPPCILSPEPQQLDRFDSLPDSLLLLIFNNLADVKALGRCSSVSRRFHSLVPQVQNVVVRVDCVISDDDPSSSSNSSDKSRSISTLFRVLIGGIFKPIQALGQFLGPKRSSPPSTAATSPLSSPSTSSLSVGTVDGDDLEQGGGVTHHSPTQVLKNFNEIRFLKIELPSGELGLEDDVLLRWRADFGSTLDNCVMLGASSVVYPDKVASNLSNCDVIGGNDDNGSIPESFYTNGGLKLRVVWTISSLIAASARHYLLQPIIAEHKTLDSLVLTDADGQGVLCMNREQLEELRVKPLSASSASKRTLVPALNMRLWYAPYLELPDGTVLKGATLVATRPSDQSVQREVSDGLWVSSAFEEPFGTAAKMLVKRRTYCLEMNSF
ncbi:putative F-box domain-containing protein [Helianthus annuus]|uniref:F-box domain-containing protein n=2 Tax=Helianthus annuus TaxID=4232 RepID=A0A251V0N2_HELAN|nr:putative F-box domain-containing protein [Helianthus annuus]KAJ0581501.1 putative F-box protein AUF1 [Helianthus annuus]KAJ0589468.1 putative F-box domain-containing protein [Helianthus annuus]KAJ0758108.1 putative F-box protein AUF1 [Helianthus annuus]KAJ0761775.1 putative F-box protein AUF1 [Helianthus annuus]